MLYRTTEIQVCLPQQEKDMKGERGKLRIKMEKGTSIICIAVTLWVISIKPFMKAKLSDSHDNFDEQENAGKNQQVSGSMHIDIP